MTKFKKKKLVDSVLAEEGIDVRVVETGVYFGTFHIRYFDAFSMSVSKDLNFLHKREAKRLKVAALDEMQALRNTLCNYVLTDWSEVEGADDKPVDFSPEVAMEFFEDEDHTFIMVRLMNESRDPANFASDEAIEAAKN